MRSRAGAVALRLVWMCLFPAIVAAGPAVGPGSDSPIRDAPDSPSAPRAATRVPVHAVPAPVGAVVADPLPRTVTATRPEVVVVQRVGSSRSGEGAGAGVRFRQGSGAGSEGVAVVEDAWDVERLSGVGRLREGRLEVIYWPGDEAMARRTLRAASRPLRLPGIALSAAPPEARLVLAPDAAAFDSLTRGAPHWSAGIAVPSRRLIVLPAYGSARTPMGDPLVALRHELVHLALNEHLPGRVPRWFDEGYATWASGEWDQGRGWEVRLALLGGGAPPLDSLRLGWPGEAGDARLAYLLSASAVSFLAERSGEEALRAFFHAWRREGDFDTALRATYGLTRSQFEDQWRSMVKRRYGWLLALSQMGVVWAVVAALVILLTVPRRRRNREKLHRMRVEEWAEEWADEADESDESEPARRED